MELVGFMRAECGPGKGRGGGGGGGGESNLVTVRESFARGFFISLDFARKFFRLGFGF